MSELLDAILLASRASSKVSGARFAVCCPRTSLEVDEELGTVAAAGFEGNGPRGPHTCNRQVNSDLRGRNCRSRNFQRRALTLAAPAYSSAGQIHGVELILIRLSHNVRQRPRENSACTLSSTDFQAPPLLCI